MNYLWGSMILIGIIYGTLTGNIEAVSEAVLSSSKEAVTLCITMLGVMALWTGIMEIAKDAGLIQAAAKRIRPLIHFLFPGIPREHAANEHITTNFIANFLGLGWAATPAGLKAMEALAELEEERRNEADPGGAGTIWKNTDNMRKKSMFRAMPRGVASNEMCTFLILNISSLQLIPVNIIAYRSQYGSVNPTAIVGPGILATAVSTGVAVVFCKVMNRRRRKE
ncbi:MAG: nucleoside recognition protein [Lachnospiraceae bacterium]|nr:nucleoside recognition protein [Lachnospiraceae bacterium]